MAPYSCIDCMSMYDGTKLCPILEQAIKQYQTFTEAENNFICALFEA